MAGPYHIQPTAPDAFVSLKVSEQRPLHTHMYGTYTYISVNNLEWIGIYLARAAWFTLRRDMLVSLEVMIDGMECIHCIDWAITEWVLVEKIWYSNTHACNQIITYRTPALGLRSRVSRGRITLHNAALHIGIAAEVFVVRAHWSRFGCVVANSEVSLGPTTFR